MLGCHGRGSFEQLSSSARKGGTAMARTHGVPQVSFQNVALLKKPASMLE